MKIIIWFVVACLGLSGCSASVRPIYADTDDVSEAMIARADGLGLALSDSSTALLAKALAQGESFCASSQQGMQIKVVEKARNGAMVPVVHVQCE